MTQKCINCRKEIEWARLAVLGHTSMCGKCAHKFTGHKSQGLTYTGMNFTMDTVVKVKKVPNSQMVFSVIREDTLPHVSTPFKRVKKPTLGVIRNGALWTMQVSITRSVNRVIDDNAASSYDFCDSSREFDTSVPRSANRNSGD